MQVKLHFKIKFKWNRTVQVGFMYQMCKAKFHYTAEALNQHKQFYSNSKKCIASKAWIIFKRSTLIAATLTVRFSSHVFLGFFRKEHVNYCSSLIRYNFAFICIYIRMSSSLLLQHRYFFQLLLGCPATYGQLRTTVEGASSLTRY